MVSLLLVMVWSASVASIDASDTHRMLLMRSDPHLLADDASLGLKLKVPLLSLPLNTIVDDDDKNRLLIVGARDKVCATEILLHGEGNDLQTVGFICSIIF